MLIKQGRTFWLQEDIDQEITISSIYGSAKATQEADNVMILQTRRLSASTAKKYIQVRHRLNLTQFLLCNKLRSPCKV